MTTQMNKTVDRHFEYTVPLSSHIELDVDEMVYFGTWKWVDDILYFSVPRLVRNRVVDEIMNRRTV